MQITGANDVDIMLDEDGQPVSDGNGDTALVSDDECWLQDIKNEASHTWKNPVSHKHTHQE